MPKEVSRTRLYLLRAMYLFIAVGLIITTWPEIAGSSGQAADSHTVISSFLAAIALLALLGLRYPLKMLPLLIFELIWKAIWLLVFAVPMYLGEGLDEYAIGVAFACGMGVVLTPLVIPWRYVANQYFLEKGSAWR